MNCYEVAGDDKRTTKRRQRCVCLGADFRGRMKTLSGKAMTLQMVATQVGITQGHLHQLETGLVGPSLQVALRLAKFYAVNVEDLWPPARNSQWFP